MEHMASAPKDPKEVHPFFFWISAILFAGSGSLFILENYNLLLAKGALAVEIDSAYAAPVSSGTDICACERTFAAPVDISWQGRVMASFVGGDGLGIERTEAAPEDGHQRFYVDAGGRAGDADEVEVKGKWIGITCAYAGTVFQGCVPEVEAENITGLDEPGRRQHPDAY